MSTRTFIDKRLARLGYPVAADKPGPLGWLSPSARADAGQARRLYCEFHGLSARAKDAEIAAHMRQPRCAHPDLDGSPLASTSERAPLSQWPRWHTVRVRLASDFALPGLSPHYTRAVFERSCAQWAAVCGIAFSFEFDGSANIYPSVGYVDGPRGTLAWSHLPPLGANGSERLFQTYDSAEVWAAVPRWTQAVVTHEIGHAIGLGHTNDQQAIMYPLARTEVWRPGSTDTRGAVARYGPPRPKPEPDIPPDPAESFDRWELLLRVKTSQGKLEIERVEARKDGEQ